MNRSEIIDLVVVRASGTPGELQRLRLALSAKSTEELEQIHHQILLEAADDQLIQIQVEREANRLWHQYEMQQAREPQRKAQEEAQLKQDREVFNEAVVKLGLSNVESNFSLIRQVLGPGFTTWSIQQAIQSNAIQLVKATQRELDQRRQQAAEERQEYLINQASPGELRAAARTESEQSRAQAQREENQRQIQAREAKDAGLFPSLPESTSDGVKLDAGFFKKLADINTKLYRQYCNKYGFANITARLNGVR